MSVSKSSVPESGAPGAGVNVGGDEMVNAGEEQNCAIVAQIRTKNLLFMRVVHLPNFNGRLTTESQARPPTQLVCPQVKSGILKL